MKLAEDGDDWGMLVPAALLCIKIAQSEQMPRCQARRRRTLEAADARPVKGRSKVRIITNLGCSALPALHEAVPIVLRTLGALPRPNQACHW